MMSLSATSRIPVEIWETILRMVITGMEFLNPDPYDVPPAKLLATYVRARPYDQYKDYMAQILKLRLVCKSWDSFVNPFIDLVVSLDQLRNTKNDQIDDIKKLSQAIRIVVFTLHPICGCRFGARCQACRELYYSGTYSADYMHKVLSAKILDGVEEEELCALLESPEPFPNLEAMTLSCYLWFIWPTSEIAVHRLSNLVFLSLQVTPAGSVVQMSLDFPRLRSLELLAKGADGIRGWTWKLPLLTTLILELANCDIDVLIEVINKITPNLKFLSLPDKGNFNVEHASQIWSLLPYLVAFACPVDFFLAHLPPSNHPLQSFLGYDMGRRSLPKILACAKGWKNCRTLMARFLWIPQFEHVLSKKLLVISEKDRNFFWRCSDRLRGGLELSDLGVRYEDRQGISFMEACDKFGGATPISSVKSFIDSVMVALGEKPIYADVQPLSQAEGDCFANGSEGPDCGGVQRDGGDLSARFTVA